MISKAFDRSLIAIANCTCSNARPWDSQRGVLLYSNDVANMAVLSRAIVSAVFDAISINASTLLGYDEVV